MSFVPAVRDYIGLLNNLYDSTSTDPNIEIIIRSTVIYLFETIRYFVFYLLTFQWFRDLSYLPIITPQISLSLIKENLFLQDPLTPFFTFLETPALSNNRFLIGLLNSFFTCLPISCSSLICFYRLMVNGIPAAFFAFLGNILGQSCFLFCVLFGLRSFIIPWFSLEPLNYVIGLYIVLNIILQIIQKRFWRPIQSWEKNRLFSIFLTHFFLIWTEEPSIYQHIGNLTLSSDSTILETLTSNQDIEFFLSHGFYLLGFIIGSVLFSVLFGIVLLKIRSFSLYKFNIRYSVWLGRFHIISILWITILTFASMPYYGFDYLFTNCFGFVSYDTALEKTFFHPSSFKENMLHKETGNDEGFYYRRSGSLVDLASFDKSYYLVSRKQVYGDDSFFLIDNFEQLNYQAEHAWTTRNRRKQGEHRKLFPPRSFAKLHSDKEYLKKREAYFPRRKKKEDRFSLFPSLNSLRERDNPLSFRQSLQSSLAPSEGNQEGRNTFLNSQETEFKILQLLSPFSLQNDWLTNLSSQQSEEQEIINQDEERSGGFDTITGGDLLTNYEGKLKEEALPPEYSFYSRKNDNPRSNSFSHSLSNPFYDSDSTSMPSFLSKFFYRTSTASFLPAFSPDNFMTRREKRAKNLFYTNPLYRFLLERDVDAFLSRQPKNHFLSVFEEKQLGRNRLVLNDYYNTLRSYRLLPSWDAFQDQFNGSLSYANKIYNQQFKGTLSLVRRLFSITVNPPSFGQSLPPSFGQSLPPSKGQSPSPLEGDSLRSKEEDSTRRVEGSQEGDATNKITTNGSNANVPFGKHNCARTNDRILKLDQPLYKTNIGNTSMQSMVAQLPQAIEPSSDLLGDDDEKEDQFKVKEGVNTNLQDKIDLDEFEEFEDLPNLLMHEEAQNSLRTTPTQSLTNSDTHDSETLHPSGRDYLDSPDREYNHSDVLPSEDSLFSNQEEPFSFPLIESTNPAPFYIGWDEKSRKMVITNRRLFSLNQNVPILAESFDKQFFVSDGKEPNLKRKDGKFTAWPIPKSMLESTKREGKLYSKDEGDLYLPPIGTKDRALNPSMRKMEKNFSMGNTKSTSFPYLPYKKLFDSLDTQGKGKPFEIALLLESEEAIRTMREEKEKREEIPANLHFFYSPYSFYKALSPNRGGFVWPGTKSSMSR